MITKTTGTALRARALNAPRQLLKPFGAGLRRLFLLLLCGMAPMVAWAADPQITQVIDTPDPVPAGGLYTYTIGVDNNAVDAATNTVLTFTVPAGAQFISAAPASQNCQLVAPTQVVCALGSLGASQSDARSIVLTWRATVTVPPAGTAIVNATATLTADNDSNPNNNTQSAVTTVVEGANLSLTNTGAPDPVTGGGTITYTLTTGNAGPNAGGAMVLTNNLPPAVTFVSATGTGWACSAAGQVVTCNRAGSHAVGAAIAPVIIVGTVNASGGTITNSASVQPDLGGVADPDLSNNTATVTHTVLPGADLQIQQKSVTSAQPAAGGSAVSFLIKPRNAGPAAAVNAVVTDELPSGWSYVSASGPNWSCSATGQTVRCTRASLAVGAVDDLTVVATAPSTGLGAGITFTNTATIASDTADPIPGNNSASANIVVRPNGADLSILMSLSPSPVSVGSIMAAAVTVTNNGPKVATGPLRVVLKLTGESYVGFVGSDWTCAATGTVVTCNHPNAGGLAVGAALPPLTINTRAEQPVNVLVEACTGSSVPGSASGATASPPIEGDPNPANDCVLLNAASTVERTDLAISKVASTANGDKTLNTNESALTYRLVVSNVSTSGDAATGARFTDIVPAFVSPVTGVNGVVTPGTTFGAFVPVVSAGSTARFSCSSSGATVSCFQSGGRLAPGETVSVDVVVNRPLLDGPFRNTATVSNFVEGDPIDVNNTASDDVVIQPIADVAMTGNTVTPGAVRAGENATYVLSYRNNGPSPATGVVVTNTFTLPPGDAGFTVVSVSAPGATCSIRANDVYTPGMAGGPTFTCTVGNINPGRVGSVTVVVRPNWMLANGVRTFASTANITTTSIENPAGGNNGNNSQSVTLTVNPAVLNLLINKTDVVDPVPYYISSPFTFMDYKVTVSNAGPSYATGVQFTEVMTPPVGKQVKFVCDTTTAGGSTCNAPSLCNVTNITSLAGVALPTITCAIPAGTKAVGLARGDLASGQSKLVFLRYQVLNQPEPQGDVFNDVVTVSSNEPDTDPLNNSTAEATTVRQRVDLRVTKLSSAASVKINEPFTWTIRVVNNGPGTSLRTDLTDVLPTGASVLPGQSVAFTYPSSNLRAGGTCTVAGSNIGCSLGNLAKDEVADITVPVRFTAYPGGNGQATNVATVDTNPAKTGGVDQPGGNNVGSSTVQVTKSTLTGTVFEDRDRATGHGGVPQDAGVEPRVVGVTVRLTGRDVWGNDVVRTAATDGNGNYLLDDLPPSDVNGYSVVETQPAGYINSPVSPPAAGANAPTAGGTYASGGGSGDSSYTGIAIDGVSAAARYNFPEVHRPSLSGYVYLDNNASGTREAATDAPVANAVVRLRDASTGVVVAAANADPSGAYSFTNLDPLITYTLEQPLPSLPANITNGPVNPGLVGGVACATGCVAQPNVPSVGTDRIANINLSSGADGTEFNFGEQPLASISGLVYVDANRNNALDASDTGRLAGVTIRLMQGADCASGTVLQTATTGADGSYRFDNVLVGQAYLVCETQPAAYGIGNGNGVAGSNLITIGALPPGGSANNTFGETLASLSGKVYQDNGPGSAGAANNGIQDSGEVGIANVPITLTGTDVLGNAVNRTVNTDSSGTWLFDGLLPPTASGYTITEGAIPLASGTFVDGRETVGNAGGSSTVNDQFAGIALAAGQQATGYLFGELGIAPISGTVYIDLNRNGSLDPVPTDGRIPGVTINLVAGANCSGAVVATATTDSQGRYSFSGALAGLTYTLCEVQPASYINGAENPGVNGSSAAANAITITNLPSSGSTGNHFGELASNSAITGRVWLDANNDGVIDSNESGLVGVTIELSGTDLGGNAVARSTVTDAQGNYRFDNLAPGTYAVRQPAQPAGTLDGRTVLGTGGGTATAAGSAPAVPSGITNISVGQSQTVSGNNFGEIPPAQLSGQVFVDLNNNGRPDAGEAGLSGVTIVLTGTDDTGASVSVSTTTASDGSYSFSNLRPGTFTVAEPTQPAGTVNGITTAGSSGGTATASAVTPSAISAVVLTPGANSSGNNFAEAAQSPDLRVSKQHAPATFTVNNRGTYTITVRNAGELPTSGAYTVTDRLPAGLTLAAPATGTGWACQGKVGDAVLTCTSSAVIAAGSQAAATITVPVNVAAPAAANSPVSNVVMVEGGGEADSRRPSDAERALFAGNPGSLPVCDPAVVHNLCRNPTPVQWPAAISGTVWSDVGTSTHLLDAADKRLAGWIVEVVNPATGDIVGRAATGADGQYRVGDLLPGVELQVRFRDPVSGIVFGYPVNGHTAPGSSGATCDAAGAISRGAASSCAGSGASPWLAVVLVAGQELTQQSLPVDPSGVVYDAGNRQPVSGSVVTLTPVGTCSGWNPATQLVGASLGGYAIQGASVSMTVGAEGFYQFLFGPNAPARCTFGLAVSPPQGYNSPSVIIPPTAGVFAPTGGPTTVVAVQPQAAAPTAAPGSATQYWLQFTAGSAAPNIVHNHVPIDPALPGGISLSKAGDKAVAEVGDTVRYTVTVQLTSGARPHQTTVVDRLPAGFTFVRGTAMVDGLPIADPVGAPGPVLAFNLGAMSASNRLVLQYRVRVGVGAAQGDGVNRARAHACGMPAGCVGPDGRTPLTMSVATNEGQYRVRVSGGVFAPEACVLGKVFVDCNNNHVQDAEELGVPGVRLVLSDGTTLVSDVEGKYSVCGLPPRSHVLRIDPHTLPRGSRLTTSSNRNLGDAGSLFLDLKNGELHRADFVEGSCSNTVLEQVKARRAQGEVRAPETERANTPALRFDSKAHGRDTLTSPQQGTDGANQLAPKPRDAPTPAAKGAAAADEQNQPTFTLPMNQPPPPGRDTGTAPGSAPRAGGADAAR